MSDYWLNGTSAAEDHEEYDAFLINCGNDLCSNWRDYLSPEKRKNY